MIPPDYKCSVCGTTGVKLWRGYNELKVELQCGACAENSQNRSIDLVESDQIAWLVPAVPDLNGAYWGYMSIPHEGYEWWKALPLRLTGEWQDKQGLCRWYPYRKGMDLWMTDHKKIQILRISQDYTTVLLRFNS